MRARIYRHLRTAFLDLGHVFAPSEETPLNAFSEVSAKELLQLRQHVLNVFPDATIEREKLFRAEPVYISLVVLTSAENSQVASSLDQMAAEGHIAAWENVDQVKRPSLCWMLGKRPRSFKLSRDLQGYLQTRDFGIYHLRVFADDLPDLRLAGINASTGQSVSSPSECENEVITLDFSLDLGNWLLLWCYQGKHEPEQTVATAMLRLMSHITIEQEEGIHIQHWHSASGVSLSP